VSNWQQSYQEIKLSSTTTAVQVLELNTPSLNQLGKVGSEMKGVAVFQFAILNLVDYMGASWNAAQINEAGELAYTEAYWLSLAELKLFINRIKTSFYKSHKNFTPVVFMEFLQEFTAEMYHERGAYFAAQQKKSDWVEPENPVTPEMWSELISNLEANLSASKENEAAKTEAFNRLENYRKRNIPEHIQAEMDRLYNQQPKQNDDSPIVLEIDKVLETFKGVKLK
jgi:hypothetical protein